MWARSYWFYDYVSWHNVTWTGIDSGTPWTSYHAAYLQSGKGGLCLELATGGFDYFDDVLPEGRYIRRSVTDNPRYPVLGQLATPFTILVDSFGFQVCYDHTNNLPNQRTRRVRITVPYWTLVVATLILPAWSSRRWIRSPGTLPGHCPTCNYDLRATPDRCPECGTVPHGVPME